MTTITLSMTAHQLRALLKKNELTQCQLAEMVNVNCRTIERYCQNKYEIPAAMVLLIKTVLNAR